MQLSFEQVLVWLLAFASYFLGIVIRKIAMPSPDAPSMAKQLLLGVPVSLVVVPVLSGVLQSAVQSSTTSSAAILVTLGLIMEHGMILNESIAKQLKERLQTAASA